MNNIDKYCNEKIHFIQINLHNCVASSPALNEYMLNNNIDLALIQEPHYYYDNNISGFSLNFQKIYFEDRPRAAIVLNPKKFKIMALNKYMNRDQVWAVIEYNHQLIYICSAYMSPTEDINTSINLINKTYAEKKQQIQILCLKSHMEFDTYKSKKEKQLKDNLIKQLNKVLKQKQIHIDDLNEMKSKLDDIERGLGELKQLLIDINYDEPKSNIQIIKRRYVEAGKVEEYLTKTL